MKSASILLALVVVLGPAGKTLAEPANQEAHNCTIMVGHHSFGFADFYSEMAERQESNIYLGPYGTHEVPFTATHGLIGFCFILAMLIIVPVVRTVRWKKQRANH